MWVRAQRLTAVASRGHPFTDSIRWVETALSHILLRYVRFMLQSVNYFCKNVFQEYLYNQTSYPNGVKFNYGASRHLGHFVQKHFYKRTVVEMMSLSGLN